MKWISLFWVLGLFFITIEPRAQACMGDSLKFRTMPKSFGRPTSSMVENNFLPCDTMIVQKGDTTRIYAGQRLAFAADKRERNRIIFVLGTLIATGSPMGQVDFAGTLEEYPFGLRPSKTRWEGIEVEKDGELHLENTSIFSASVPVKSASEKVTFKNVSLRDGQLLASPTEFIQLNLDTEIKELSFAKKNSKAVFM